MDVRFHATLRQAVGGKHVQVDWHDGLTGLAVALLQTTLTRYVVTGPRAPRYPWASGLDSRPEPTY